MNLPPPPDRWTIDIANAERINAISSFGFTERQARFLVNVLLHSGVFVERQYCAFAGIVHGQKSTDFINVLVERRYATPITTGRLHRGACSTFTTSLCGLQSASPTADSGSLQHRAG